MKRVVWMSLVVLIYGCGGGGGGNSSGGDTDPTLPFPATLSSIQEKVFTPTCALVCHKPGGEGVDNTAVSGGISLDLSSKGISFDRLVNIESTIGDICGATPVEDGDLPCGDRVEPGDPDRSWLIVKLEGTHPRIGTSAGDRMPLNSPALGDDVIGVIRQWIKEGAPNN